MKSQPKKIIFLDLDGTLLGKGGALLQDERGQISTDAAGFLTRILEKDVKPVILSSRTKSQVREVSRLLNSIDFIAEMGRVLGFNGGKDVVEVKLKKLENPYWLYRKGYFNSLLKEFKGLIELHEPWWRLSKYSLMLRGCLKGNNHYLLQELNEALNQLGFLFLRAVENGKTQRSENLRCSERRIYHLLNRKISKEKGVQRYLQSLGLELNELELYAAGDAASDLEVVPFVKVFFFMGSESELENCLKMLTFQNFEAKIEDIYDKIRVCKTRKIFFEEFLQEIEGKQ